jgi:predicted MFS family arabinose efflux permease
LNELGGYRLAFVLAAGVAFCALLVALFTKEPRLEHHRPSVVAVGKIAVQRSLVIPTFFNTLLHYAVYATSFGFLPILAKELGATDIMLSVLMSAYLAMSTLGALIAVTTAERGCDQQLVHMSLLCLLVGIGAMAFASNLLMFGLGQCFLGLAFGTGYSVLMGLSIRDVESASRATAMGIHQATCGIGMFAGSWVGGLLANLLGIRQMFMVTGLACLILIVGVDLWQFWIRPAGVG